MSQISSAHKVENTNKSVLQQLQNTLDFCEKYGHQPEPESDLGVIMKKVQHLTFVRKANGIAIPEEIPNLYAKIRSFQTAAKHRRREMRANEEIMKNVQQLTLKQNYERIQKLTSHNLNIFKFIFGDSKFNRFLNTGIDPLATKAVLDYFFAIYYNPRFSPFIGRSVFSQRDRRFIELRVGDYTGKDTDDMKKTLKYRTNAKYMPQVPEKEREKLIAKIEHEEPLTSTEIGYLHYMTWQNVSRVLCGAHRDFHNSFKNFESLLDSYINGDVAAVMSKLPAKFAAMYKYQQDKKIQDIPTDVINSTGKTLMEFFAENLRTKQH